MTENAGSIGTATAKGEIAIKGGLLSFIPCHRRKDRTIHVFGKPMPLCARCSAILLGYGAVPVFLFCQIEKPLILFLLLSIPMLLDGFTQKWGWRESNNTLRFVTGLGFGVGQALLVSWLVWGLVDVARDLS